MKVAYLGCSGNISTAMGETDTEGMAADKRCTVKAVGDQRVTLQGNSGKQRRTYASELYLPEGEGTGVYFYTNFC